MSVLRTEGLTTHLFKVRRFTIQHANTSTLTRDTLLKHRQTQHDIISSSKPRHAKTHITTPANTSQHIHTTHSRSDI